MTPLQRALDAIAAFPTPDDDSKVIAAKARGLMIGYDARWANTGWEMVSVEEEYHLPVINPETGARSRTFTQSGKVDGIVRHSGRLYLLEHKTTSENIIETNAVYWRRLAIDSQVSAYVLAKWQQGQKLDGTLYDVIRKPQIQPKNLSKADRTHIAANKTYFGYAVSSELAQRVAFEQDRECPELYAMRLASECTEQPDKYFARRIVPRLDSEVGEYAEELWEVGQSIISARTRNAHYRNSSACVEYNTPCAYLGICSGHDSPDSDNWERAQNVHAELHTLGNDGRSVLTNSRLKVFQSCRRKHYFKFELGLRRRDEEEREALVFGSLLHEALAAWWSSFMKGTANVNGQDAACGTESPAAADCETQSTH